MAEESYYARNRERQLALAKAYRESHKEKYRAYQKEYYLKHKEKKRAYFLQSNVTVVKKVKDQPIQTRVFLPVVPLEGSTGTFTRQEGTFSVSWD